MQRTHQVGLFGEPAPHLGEWPQVRAWSLTEYGSNPSERFQVNPRLRRPGTYRASNASSARLRLLMGR